ncbi:MAG: hypothetical protein QOH71_2324 [Blastocatellia bacterium]|nr:hypothetical protein [Blastocatellia bacterium]
MHLPSDRVYREMRSEEASLWYVPANGGEEIALLIKAPSSSIKALLAGCPLRLVFGRNGTHLTTGVRILDMPDAPIFISGMQREAEEHQALSRALQERCLPVFLFNEMDVCLAWTNLDLMESDSTQVAEVLGRVEDLYVGAFTPECSHSLDCFCYSVDNTLTYPEATTISVVNIPTTLEPWRTNDVFFIGFRGHHTITLDHPDEGEMFERAVWASLESVFPLTLHKNPQVRIGKKTRELTDVLAFYEYGSFLIEAKDLSVLHAGFERDQERRTKGVQKQIKKAIAQLVGASRGLTSGKTIFSVDGTELNLIRDKPAHCIVLITELMHWGEWGEVETQLAEAMGSTGDFFHLLDLREFIILLKGSSGKAPLLDYNLMERCKIFAQNGSVHIRGRIAPNRGKELPDCDLE